MSDSPMADFLVEKQPWVADSVCLGLDPELFFDSTEGMHYCASCPVRTPCGEQALVEEGAAPYGRYGVRGGMTAPQRETIYRRGGLRGRDPAQLCAGRDGRRRIPPVPLEGVSWSRHHTTLARKLHAWLVDGGAPKGWRLPSVPALCEELECNPVPLKHVLNELWASGTIDKVDGRFKVRALHSNLPRILRSTPSGEGDSHA